MRFHMLQNVQTSLNYLRYRKVSQQVGKVAEVQFIIPPVCLFIDQVGQHPRRRYRRQQPETDSRIDMDHHSPLSGEMRVIFRLIDQRPNRVGHVPSTSRRGPEGGRFHHLRHLEIGQRLCYREYLRAKLGTVRGGSRIGIWLCRDKRKWRHMFARVPVASGGPVGWWAWSRSVPWRIWSKYESCCQERLEQEIAIEKIIKKNYITKN